MVQTGRSCRRPRRGGDGGIRGVADVELDVLQAEALGSPPGEVDPPRVQVDAADVKFRRDGGEIERKQAKPAADVQNVAAPRQVLADLRSIRRRKLKQRIRLYKRTEGSSYARMMPRIALSFPESLPMTIPSIRPPGLLDNRLCLGWNGDMSSAKPRDALPPSARSLFFTQSLPIVTLLNLALAARLYEMLGRQPAFFVVRRAEAIDLIALAAIFSLLLPAAVAICVWGIGLAWRPLGQAAFALVVAAAMTAIVLPLVVGRRGRLRRCFGRASPGACSPRGPIFVSPRFDASSPSSGRRRSCCPACSSSPRRPHASCSGPVGRRCWT